MPEYELRLFDGADGVRGHYCVGYTDANGTSYYWGDLGGGRFGWASAGVVLISRTAAEALRASLTALITRTTDAVDTEVVTVREGEDGRWTADRMHLPGSPIIGRGKTWLEAVGALAIQDPERFGIKVKVFTKDGEPASANLLGRAGPYDLAAR
jgi:hypothetical protein